jgi:hypothetical protein
MSEAEEPRYTVILKSLTTPESKEKVVALLVRITKNATPEFFHERLEHLPLTLTKSATAMRAAKLVKKLEQQGAIAEVQPPLPASVDEILQTGATSGVQPAPATQSPGMSPRPEERATSPTVASPEPVTQEAYGAQTEETQRTGPIDFGPSLSGPIDIEPLTLSGLLDRTFQICRSHFWQLAGILLVPWLVIAVLFVLGALVFLAVGMTWQSLGQAGMIILVIIGSLAGIGVFLLLMVLFYLSQGALIHAVARVHLGASVGIRDAYTFVFERLWQFILTCLLAGLAMLGTVIAPMLAGFVLFVLFELIAGSGWWSALFWLPLSLVPMYAIPKLMLFDKVVIVEDTPYTGAIKRSWELISGQAEGPWPRSYWLKIVVLLHLFVLINIAVSVIFSIPGQIILVALPEALQIVGQIVHQIISTVGSVIAGMFGAVCLVVFYYDIRARKEGFDLQVLAKMK